MSLQVERLKINYKTLEEFQQFREYGLPELSMLEDLQTNFIENDSISPFYGIYVNEQLVARMSLYEVDAKYDHYFSPPQKFYELWKLEVLPDYRNQKLGSSLVQFAKGLNYPIKTNARHRSDSFWKKMGFAPLKYNPVRDRGESPYVWIPEGVNIQE